MASQQHTAPAQAPETNFASEPKTFHCFRKLAPELRDMIWKLAAPGPRIVPVDAGNPFLRSAPTSLEKAGGNMLKAVNTYEFKIGFVRDTDDHGMLRACKESRYIMVKMLPIRLPSKDFNKELRLGPHDFLMIAEPGDFFYALKMALRANSPQSRARYLTSIESFMHTVVDGFDFRHALLALKSSQSVVFCLSSEPQFHPNEEDCLSDYTADFDPSALKTRRSRLFHFANTQAETLKSKMKTWQDREKDKYPNLPEVRIMAKGWPVKKLPAEKRIKKQRLQGAGSGTTTLN